MLNRRSLLKGLVGGSALGGMATSGVDAGEPRAAIQDWHLDIETLAALYDEFRTKEQPPRPVDFRTITEIRDGERIIARTQWTMRKRIEPLLECLLRGRSAVPFRAHGHSFAFLCRSRGPMRKYVNGKWRSAPSRMSVEYLWHNPADHDAMGYAIGPCRDFAPLDDAKVARFNEVNSLLRRIEFAEKQLQAWELSEFNKCGSTTYQMRFV